MEYAPFLMMNAAFSYWFIQRQEAARLEEEEDHEIQLKRNIWESRHLDNKTFLKMFRMTRPDFFWLVQELEETLLQDEGDDDPLSVETQIAVSLYYLGHGSSFSKLEELFGLDEGVAK
ncbi:hypothetical protein DFS34DRAFT_321235 [Phlyctochytrium arcticum]|nr:hypothetical protein DFS34DRAFT_321235 [Phlyctochytrium arcticum]